MADKAQSHHHILPLRVYFGVAGALFVLTAVTVFVSFYHFGDLNIIVAMAIAATKGTLVALFFMHLKYDNKLYMTIFVLSLIFLAVFLGFTMLDTSFRGEIDNIEGPPIDPDAVIYEQQKN
jgi:cytochrome c oxidase subunit 4